MIKYFNEESIKQYYFHNLRGKISSTGIDKVTRLNFENRLNQNVNLISRKCIACTYEFTPYRGILIQKGYDKLPRVIGIAGVRDKLVLCILNRILFEQFSEIKIELVQTKIHTIKQNLCSYNSFIKIDISNFFGSINHDILMKKVTSRIEEKAIIRLLQKAITTPVKSDAFLDTRHIVQRKGIPQGIPISNVLAEIFITDIDKKYIQKSNLKYYRYVDDILIMCDGKESQAILDEIKVDMQSIDLVVNDEKTKIYSVKDEFTYLGYKIKNSRFSARQSSVQRHEKSLELLFHDYVKSQNKNVNAFIWKLNLKITGFVFDDKKYGWLFFFSQIDDLQVLSHLDNFVEKLFVRFKIKKEDEKLRRYMRAYSEIIYNLNGTKYIPNFALYTIETKKDVLREIFDIDTTALSDEDIEFQFSRTISSIARKFEKDVQDIS